MFLSMSLDLLWPEAIDKSAQQRLLATGIVAFSC
jgi:hypothetical protein